MEQKQVRKNNTKKLLRWLLNIVLVFITIPFVLTFMFRDPMVQSLSARMITKWLSDKTGYHISLEKVKLTAFKGFEFSGLEVDDHRGEEMLHIDHLKAQPEYSEWEFLFFKFKCLNIDGAHFRYAQYAKDDNYNLMIFLDKYLNSDTTDKTKKPGNFHLNVKRLVLTNSMFHLYDEHQHYSNEKGVNYADMLIDSIYLYAEDFHLINDSLHTRVDSLFAREKSGFEIKRMSAEFGISSTNLTAHNLLLDSYNSHIDMDLDFDYAGYGNYSDFIDSVVMTGKIRPSTIDLGVIGYFADIMFQMPDVVGISGFVTGPVSLMKGDHLRVKYGNNSRFYGNVMIKGLPDFFTSYMEAEIFELSATPCDLRSFSIPAEQQHVDVTGMFDCNELFTAKGWFKGYYEDFKADLAVKMYEGVLKTDINYKKQQDNNLVIHAHVTGQNFDVGNFLGIQDQFGKVSMDVVADARGKSLDDIRIDVDGFLRHLVFNGYDYRRVVIKGWYQHDSLNGIVRVGDKNLMMGGDVALNLSDGPLLKTRMVIKKANLNKLHFVQGKKFEITTLADLTLKGFDVDDLSGKLVLDNTILYFSDKDYNLKRIVVRKTHSDTDTLDIKSDYVDASMKGKFKLSEFNDHLNGLLRHYYQIGNSSKDTVALPEQYADINVQLKDATIIEDQLIPGLYLSPDTYFSASLDFPENNLLLHFNSPVIEYGGVTFNSNNLSLQTDRNVLNYDFTTDRIIFKDSTQNDKTVFGIDNFNFEGSAADDSITYGVYWDNYDTIRQNTALWEGYVVKHNGASVIKTTKSDIYINDTLWQVNRESSVVMDTSGIHFNDLEIHGGRSTMEISGIYPDTDRDTLSVRFHQWDLSHFDIITRLSYFDLSGKINGSINLSRVMGNLTFESSLKIDEFVFNDEFLGTADLSSEWNSSGKYAYLDADIIRKGASGSGKVLVATGYYYPFREQDNFDIKIDFNRLKIRTIEPFLIGYISNIEGVASGKMKLNGSPDEPELTGVVDMRRAALVVDYLNTKYSFSNTVTFEPDRVNFNNLVIYDTLGNHANIDGYLTHNHFKDSEFDVHLSTDKLLFFNTNNRMNDLYYGTAITSGELKLTGKADDLKLDMNVSTLDGTKVTLPLDDAVEISDKDYIVFIHPSDSLIFDEEEPEETIEQANKEQPDELKYDIGLKMNITPSAKVQIYVPNDLGDIESQGDGDLSMQFNSDGDFTISGDYKVESGIFNLRVANLLNKRFDLVKGGRISWSGDPYQANLNIKGRHRVKTNVSSLGIVLDSTSDYKNKIVVDCYVVLTNQLNNPRMRFELKMPDLDPDIERAVFAEIDTTNPAMLNQQVMSLLVLGSFSASNASNITLSSSYYTVITNQLSKMLSRISDDFDIGINYKPGDQVSQEEFEVALSTQLFNDRLYISGNVGMTYDRAERNASSIVGDVDISYKLTEDGRWILKAYNHSNVNSWYNYSNYDKLSPYTQGVGIGYTKEFNTIAELFTRSRPRKKNKKNKDETTMIDKE